VSELRSSHLVSERLEKKLAKCKGLNWSRTRFLRETLKRWWLAKSRFRQGLIKRQAKGRDQKNKALIPNETNEVRSHKNYPKYLEYNKVIHIGL
jgi:hypothetical protein